MDIGEALDKLEDKIAKLSPKKQEVLSSWIGVWADYLKFESSFDPERLMEYRRGDIVHVHLGVNVATKKATPATRLWSIEIILRLERS